MSKRLQELQYHPLGGNVPDGTLLLIKNTSTISGSYEDFKISFQDFTQKLIRQEEATQNPLVYQIPRLVSGTGGAPALPPISGEFLTNMNLAIPVGTDVTSGVLKLSSSITSSAGVTGGFAATPSAVKAVNDLKPSKGSDETISGNWVFSGTLTGTLTGSASSLTTPRKINGTNFDGSSDITTDSWGITRNLTIGKSSKPVNGSGNTSWSISEIGSATEEAIVEAIRKGYEASGYDVEESESFETGGTINSPVEVMVFKEEGKGYSWGGAFPKIVPPGSTPSSSGGIGTTAWTSRASESISVVPITAGLVEIQNTVNTISDGTLKITPGQYTINGDITISLKNPGGSTNGEGYFTLDCTGVRFSGSGRIILDSCKRVKIIGLDAPNHDFHFRGVWWSVFEELRFKNLILGDAPGTSFSSSYWNQFIGGVSQSVIYDTAATSAHNAFMWSGHSMRGNPGQGFSGTAPYAFQFLSNQNAQAWMFLGGDISYHTDEIYTIGGGNTSGDVEFTFDGTYFDSLIPSQYPRQDVRIVTKNCHHANGVAAMSSFSAISCGSVDLFRGDRQLKHNGSFDYNLIPNGDFRDILPTYLGAGLPIGGFVGGVITRVDGGLSGSYLNLKQANTSNTQCRFRTSVINFPSKLTGVVVLRNADIGTRVVKLSFWGLANPTVTLTNTEWTVVTVTPTGFVSAGSSVDLQVYTDDGAGYNVDVAYAGVSYGEGSSIIKPSYTFKTIDYTEVWDAPSIPAGGNISKDFMVNGALNGDFAIVSPGATIGFLEMSAAAVVAPGQVRVMIRNNTAAAIDLPSSTWRVRVFKGGSYL